MAATTQAMSQEFGVTAKAVKAFHSFVQSGEVNGKYIGTAVPICAQNRHHLPHLPVLRARPSFHAFTIDVAIPILSAR
jgi:hypothetical protein